MRNPVLYQAAQVLVVQHEITGMLIFMTTVCIVVDGAYQNQYKVLL